MAPDNSSSEFTLQPDGSYGLHQVQPDGTTLYYQQLPTGEYGYFKPETDGSYSYFRQQADGSFAQWVRSADGTFVPPAGSPGVAIALPQAVAPAAPAAPVVLPAPVAAGAVEAVVTSASDVPAVSAPVAKKGRGGLIAGIAAGAVVLLGAAGAGLFMMLKGGGDSASSTTAFVKDFAEEPGEAWSFDWSLGMDTQYIDYVNYFAVGQDFMFVMPRFDVYSFEQDQDSGTSWGYNTVWSPEYEAQYDEGWDAGKRYQEDYDAYWDNWDYDLEYPELEDYWPGQSDYYLVDEATEGGLQDGFLDATNDYGYGAHMLTEPVTADFEDAMAVVDLRDGSELWSETFEDLVGEGWTFVDAEAFEGTNDVVITARNDDSDTQLVVVDGETGDELATIALDGVLGGVVSQDGYLYVSDVELDDSFQITGSTVKAFTVESIDEDPVWDFESDSGASLAVYDAFLRVGSVSVDEDGSASSDAVDYVSLTTGEVLGFSDAMGKDDVAYPLGDKILRIATSSDGEYSANVVDDDGNEVWDADVPAEHFFIIGQELLVGDEFFGSDEDAASGFTNLMRINLKDGSAAWDEPLEGVYNAHSEDQDGIFYLLDGEYLDQVDLKTGAVKQSAEADPYGVLLAKSAAYLWEDGELVALDKDDLSERWSVPIGETEDVSQVGSYLILTDYDTFELICLG